MWLRVETDRAASSEDAASWRSVRFLWTGLVISVLVLIMVSACALLPLASHVSVKLSRLVPEAAFIPSSPFLSPSVVSIARHPGKRPLRPTGFRPAALASVQQLHTISVLPMGVPAGENDLHSRYPLSVVKIVRDSLWHSRSPPYQTAPASDSGAILNHPTNFDSLPTAASLKPKLLKTKPRRPVETESVPILEEPIVPTRVPDALDRIDARLEKLVGLVDELQGREVTNDAAVFDSIDELDQLREEIEMGRQWRRWVEKDKELEVVQEDPEVSQGSAVTHDVDVPDRRDGIHQMQVEAKMGLNVWQADFDQWQDELDQFLEIGGVEPELGALGRARRQGRTRSHR